MIYNLAADKVQARLKNAQFSATLKKSTDGSVMVARGLATVVQWSLMSPGQVAAKKAVTDFYTVLDSGDFKIAAGMLYITPDEMALWNLPGTIKPDDLTGALEYACQDNAIICLPVQEIFPGGGMTSQGDYEISLSFQNKDGSLHELDGFSEFYIYARQQSDGSIKLGYLPRDN